MWFWRLALVAHVMLLFLNIPDISKSALLMILVIIKILIFQFSLSIRV